MLIFFWGPVNPARGTFDIPYPIVLFKKKKSNMHHDEFLDIKKIKIQFLKWVLGFHSFDIVFHAGSSQL